MFVQKADIILGNLRTSNDDVGPRTLAGLRQLPTTIPAHQTTHSHRSASIILTYSRYSVIRVDAWTSLKN